MNWAQSSKDEPSLAQLLQTTIAVGSASSLIFRSFAGSIPLSDTLFH